MNTLDEEESPLSKSKFAYESLDDSVVHLIAMENPFDPSTKHHEHTDWYEGMTLADALGPKIHTDHWFVTLNGGVYQDMEVWKTTLINKGDCILGAPLLRGGGANAEGNRKMAYRLIAMILIVALTIWWNPALTVYLEGLVGASFAPAVAAGINAAVIAGGTMLVNALLPIPALDINDDPGDQTYGIDGPKPTSVGNIPIPVCYGPHTMSGNAIAIHTERSGNDQYLNMLMNAGEGPINGITDIYINDQPATNFIGIETWIRTGNQGQTVIPNFDQIIIPVNVGYTLVGIDMYYHTTSVCDRLRVDVSWPAGVNRSSRSKGIKSNNVMFYMFIRRAGTQDDWEGFAGDSIFDTYNLFGLDMTTRTPQRRSYLSKPLERGAWQVAFRRMKNGHIENGDTIVITDVNELHDGEIQYNNTALLGMRVKLSDQLNALPRVTYINQGKIISTYNGSSWATEASDNPAWIAWDMLTNNRYGAGFDISRLDLPTFYEWAQFCETEGLYFHGVFGTNGQPVWDSIAPVFRAGHAIPIRIGSRYAVTIEKPKPSSMLFSSGNIKKGTLQLSWLPMEDRANEIEVSFYDKEERHKQRTISVYDTVAHASNFPMRKGRIALQGVDDEERAIREGIFTINMNRLCAVATWEAHIDAISVMIGDVVDIQHDMPQWGYGGRLEAGNGLAQLNLDIDVHFETGTSYAARVVLPDDTIEERDVVNPGTGDFSTISLQSNLSAIPPESAIWSVGEINKVVKPFVVRSISGTSDHTRNIKAIEYVPEVYDDDIAGYTPSHSALEGTIGPVTNVVISEEIDAFEFNEGSGVQIVLEWEHDDPNYSRADVYVSIERSEWLLAGTSYNNFVINDAKIDHNYYFVFVPIAQDGTRGHFQTQTEYTYFVTGVPLGAPETPVSFVGTPYSRYVDLSWYVPSNPGPGRTPNVGYFLIYWAPHYNPGVDPVPTFADAIIVGNCFDNFYTHTERVPDTDNYYWLVNANRANPEGITSPEVACTSNPVHTLTESFQSVFGRGVEDYDLSDPLKARIDTIDTPVSGLTDRMNEAEADADQALIDAAAALAAAQAAAGDAGQAQTDADSAQTDATQALADASQNAQDIIDNDGEISTIQGNVLGHNTDISNLETTVNHPATGVSANASAITALDTRVISAEGTIIGQTTDITGLQTTVDNGTSGVVANYNNYVTLDGRIDTNDGLISGHGGRLNSLETTVNHGTQGVVANYNSYVAVDARVDTVSGTVSGNVTDISNLETTVYNGTTGVAANYSALTALDTRVGDNEGDISGHGTRIIDLETTVEHGTKGVVANYNSIVTVDGRVDTNDGLISGHAGRLQTLETTVNNGTSGVTANYNSYITLDGRVDTNDGLISGHGGRLDSLETKVNNGTSGVTANYNHYVSLDGRMDTAEGTLSGHVTDITNLETTVNHGTRGVVANYNAVTTLDGRIDTNDGLISGHASRIDSLELTIDDPSTGYTVLWDWAVIADGEIDVNKGDISGHASRLESLEITVNHGTSGVTANYNNYVTLDGRVDSHDGSISGHAGRLDQLELDVYDGSTGLSVVYDWAVLADGRIGVNEGDISAQGGRLETIETTVNNPTTGGTALATVINAAQTKADTADGKATANAQTISNVSTTVGDNTDTIEVHQTSIDGIHGQYTVKIDNSSGHVAGFGLSNSAPEYSGGAGHSEFMVLVDRFAVASPTATDLSFEIESGQVRMDGAKIKDASIDNVKIGSVIQSHSFNTSTGTGWKIDKTGRIQAGEITIYDNNGDVIIQSGQSSTVLGGQIDNANMPLGQMLSDPNFKFFADNNTFSNDPNWRSFESSFKSLNDPPRGYIPYMTTGNYSVGLDKQRIPVAEGTPLYVTVSYYEETGYTSGNTIVRVFWYDKDLSSQSPQWVDYPYANQGERKNQWTSDSIVIIPPTYAGFCRVLIEGDNLVGTGKHYLEGITLSTSPTFIDSATAPTFIRDLAVNTLQIADWAVTVSAGIKMGQQLFYRDETWETLCELTVTQPNTNSIIHLEHDVSMLPCSSAGGGTMRVRITRDGVEIPHSILTVNSTLLGGSTYYSPSAYQRSTVDDTHGGGTFTYRLEAWSQYLVRAGVNIDSAKSSLVITSAKK